MSSCSHGAFALIHQLVKQPVQGHSLVYMHGAWTNLNSEARDALPPVMELLPLKLLPAP